MNIVQGFFSAFSSRGEQNEIVWIIGGGGGQAHIHVQSMWQTRGSGGHAPPGKF